MYTLTLESKNPEIFFKLELNNLEDIYKECNQTENIEKYNMREILDKIEFGINILEPGKLMKISFSNMQIVFLGLF
ncbi:hypothetical protein [Methanobrevibacter sp. UBA46]|jgi:hypothetical protein|uniref:hypothetical protein n=1 Tax=Methanobrevibacter sp. UBA46 TaxID=1915488 RepID=UPI0039B9B6F5